MTGRNRQPKSRGDPSGSVPPVVPASIAALPEEGKNPHSAPVSSTGPAMAPVPQVVWSKAQCSN